MYKVIEKQKDLFCGQHALNNLFQELKFYSDDSNLNTLIDIDGKFNMKSYCRLFETKFPGESCSNQYGNYFIDAIEYMIHWFGFDTERIDIDTGDSYQKLETHMNNETMLGGIVRHSNPDHYTCFIKDTLDKYIMIDSRYDNYIELDYPNTLLFLKSNQNWPNGFSKITKIISVFVTDCSYICESSKNKGNTTLFGYKLFKEIDKEKENEEKAQKNDFKECIVKGCDFNAVKQHIVDGEPKKIKNRLFCSYHHKIYYNYILEGFTHFEAKKMVLNNISSKKSKNLLNKCNYLIKKKYTQRRNKFNKTNLCMARTWSNGCALPCNFKSLSKSNLCKRHTKKNHFDFIYHNLPNQFKWNKNALFKEQYDSNTQLPIPYNKNDEPILIEDISNDDDSSNISKDNSINANNKSSSSSFNGFQQFQEDSPIIDDDISHNDSSSSGEEATIFPYQGEVYFVTKNNNVYKQMPNGDYIGVGKKINDDIDFQADISDDSD